MMSSATRSPCSIFKLLLASLATTVLHQAAATIYSVAPNSAGSMTIGEAMEVAVAGDTIELASGTYESAIVTVRDGAEGNPITIVGAKAAIINGDYSSRSVLVRHSYISLVGFTVDGKIGSSEVAESYVNKCVYVEGQGTEPGSPLDSFVMEELTVMNCGGECVRLKNFVTNAEIVGNIITDCGIHDYVFDWGSKNGEGIYVGTSSSQWTYGADETNDNTISKNTITTNANECVDIKEGSTGNVVEGNSCTNQLDENSGCYDGRGDANTFRYNVGTNCVGAGVRLGGWEVNGHQYGGANHVYGNDFTQVGNGAIKALTQGQGEVCGNTCEDGECGITGGVAFEEIRTTWNQACGEITSDFVPTSRTTSFTTITTVTSSSTSSSATMPEEDGSATTSSTSETTDEGNDEHDSSYSTSSSEEKTSSTSSSSSKDKSSSSSTSRTGGKATPFASSSTGTVEGGDEDSELEEEEEEESDEDPENSWDTGEDSSEDGSSSSSPGSTTDEDDYGNDHGDDFDGDDEDGKDRRNLRGARARRVL